MARARNIKPGFFHDADLVELPFETRLLFPGLWTIADREGRLEDRPRQIKMEIFPADNVDIEAMLTQLYQSAFIIRYSSNGVALIQIANFSKHQNPHRDERASMLPPPTEEDMRTMQAQCKHGASMVQIVLIPDSLNLIPDSKHRARRKQKDDTPAAKATAIASRLPKNWQPTDDDVQFLKTNRSDLDLKTTTDHFRDYWIAVAGAKGLKLDWSATWRNWVRRQEAGKARSGKPTRDEERRDTIERMTGKKSNERTANNERDITGEATRIS